MSGPSERLADRIAYLHATGHLFRPGNSQRAPQRTEVTRPQPGPNPAQPGPTRPNPNPTRPNPDGCSPAPRPPPSPPSPPGKRQVESGRTFIFDKAFPGLERAYIFGDDRQLGPVLLSTEAPEDDRAEIVAAGQARAA